MKVKTRLFGEIEIDENKIISFENGIMGFEHCRRFLLVHDVQNENNSVISWLQSIEEPELSLTVIDPLVIKPDYNPVVEDELLKSIDEMKHNDMLVLVTLTVPADLSKMTANLKAPIVINASSLKACQIIVDNEEYKVRFPVYDILKGADRKDGE